MVKILDIRSKRLIAESEVNSKIEDILRENNIFVDEFGNLKSIMGEFLQLHRSNLIVIKE